MKKLDALATPPGKLSLGSKVEEAEEASNRYLGTTSSTFVTNATAGFEIAYKYANLKAGEDKSITSFGEGGILTTTIPDFGGELKRAHFLGLDFSCPNKDWLYNITPIQGKEAPFVPGNSSTTEIQGLGLTLQVARNEEIIAIRRKAAAYLTERFAANDAIIPP